MVFVGAGIRESECRYGELLRIQRALSPSRALLYIVQRVLHA
jgi:hypothetical protein